MLNRNMYIGMERVVGLLFPRIKTEQTLCRLFQSSRRLELSVCTEKGLRASIEPTNAILLGVQKLRIQGLVGVVVVTIFLSHLLEAGDRIVRG